MPTSNLDIIINAKNNASGELQKLDTQVGGLSGVFGKLGSSGALAAGAFAAVAAGAVVVGKAILDMSAAARESIIADKQLAAVIQSTGGIAGVTAKQVDALSAEIQSLTNYDDEAAKGAQSLLLTFTKIGSEVFPRATMAIIDMSAALGQDLKSSAIQLGKALNDPIEGVSALSRVGVQFSDSQRAMISSMVETGDLAAAQGLILKEVETQVKGSAQAQADATVQLKNAWVI